MKIFQCVPAHVGETYQRMLEQTKLFGRCSQEDDWGKWASCLYNGCDCREIVKHMVKVVTNSIPYLPRHCKTCLASKAVYIG